MLTCLKGPVLSVEHVSWSSPRGAGRFAAALRDVSLDLEAGAPAGVCGRRPADLTALAAIAAGRRAPDAGVVLLDGLPLADHARRAGAPAHVGFAHRDGPEADDLDLVTWMASGLVDAGSWRTARRRAWTAIDRVGLGTAAALRWPELSSGERALAAIAQALVRGPRVLVVDGPVVDVEDDDRAAVLDLLRAFAADGVAVLATAADASQLPGFDPLWTLDADGRLAGPPPRPPAQVIPLRARRD